MKALEPLITLVLKKAGAPSKDINSITSRMGQEQTDVISKSIYSEISLEIVDSLANATTDHSIFLAGLNSKHYNMRMLSLLVLSKNVFSHSEKYAVGKSLISYLEANVARLEVDSVNVDQDVQTSENGHPSLAFMGRVCSKSSSESLERAMLQYAYVNLIESLVACSPVSICWFNVDIKSYEQQVIAVYHAICSIRRMNIREFLLKKLVSLHLMQMTIEFCSSIWSSSVSHASVFVSLAIASKAIETNTTSLDYQLILPSLFLTLNIKNKETRHMATEFLEILTVAYNKLIETPSTSKNVIYGYGTFYGKNSSCVQYLTSEAGFDLVDDLYKRRGEIIADHSYLSNNFALVVSGKERHVREDYVCFLLSNILAFYSKNAKKDLITLIHLVDTPLKIKTLQPLLESEIACLQSGGESVELLICLIKCFSTNSVKSVGSRYIKMYSKLLDVPVIAGATRVCVSAIDQITNSWFSGVDTASQTMIVSRLINLVALSTADVSTVAKSCLAELQLSEKILGAKFTEVLDSLGVSDDRSAKKCRQDNTEQNVLFPTLVSLLEVAQYNKKITENHNLISIHFQALNAILNLDSEVMPRVEYAKQLVLSNVLFFVNDNPTKIITEKSFRMDLVVQCIRVTDNPQTHNEALLLLAATGSRYPDIVLINIMPVFTFMGSNILRKDDSFSFHVIEKTLETVFPSLLSRNGQLSHVINVLVVFVKALLHIPSHRRLNIFSVILRILDEQLFLGTVLGLLVTHSFRSPLASSSDNTDYNKFAITLLHQYDGQVQLQALNSILKIAPSEREAESIVFGETASDVTQSRKMRLRLVNFIGLGLKSKLTITAIQESSHLNLQEHMQLVESILSEIESFAKLQTSKYVTGNFIFTIVMLELLYDNLHNSNIILSLPSFLKVVSNLLSGQADHQIRKRALMILNDRVQAIANNAGEIVASDFDVVLENLLSVLKCKSDRQEEMENSQLALITLSTMGQAMGEQDPQNYFNILEVVAGEYGLKHSNDAVIATSLATLSTFVKTLGTRTIPLIPQFMPYILSLAENNSGKNDEAAQILLQSIISTLSSVIDSVPLFVTCYLERMILIITSPKLNETHALAIKKGITELSKKIGIQIEHRSLFPIIVKCTKKIMEMGPMPLNRELDLLNTLIGATSSAAILELRGDWLKFFLNLFDYRNVMKGIDEVFINIIQDGTTELEANVINTFRLYTMKMNEKVFKPLFMKLVEWSLINDPSPEKKRFIFNLTDTLLGSLKSIFVPYIAFMLEPILESLESVSKPGTIDKTWMTALSILRACFIFDNDSNNYITIDFTTQERFERIMTPLLDQLETVSVHGAEYSGLMAEHVIPCVGALATAQHSDAALKTLNRQVLMKTRHLDNQVRINALLCLSELYSRLGEEMLLYFPETIPFLAELLEDDDEKVVTQCQDLCSQIETYLGEPIQGYFNAH